MLADPERLAVGFTSRREAEELLAELLLLHDGDAAIVGPVGALVECLWRLTDHENVTLDEWQRDIGGAILRDLPLRPTSAAPPAPSWSCEAPAP